MIVQCPYCFSDNVIHLIADGRDFVCDDCGENFESDSDMEIEEDEVDSDAGLIYLDPQTAWDIARQARKEDEEDDTNEP